MNEKRIQNPEQIIKILNVSANKNNTWFIFFLTFTFSILMATNSTTDLALLLPEHGVKMPLINIKLDTLDFFLLAPILLLFLHFYILFNHHKHLENLHTYKNDINANSLDPLLYNSAFKLGTHTPLGLIVNSIIWILLYVLPLLVLLIIYIRFADYHHTSTTILHLVIIIYDLILIFYFIIKNDTFYDNKDANLVVKIFNIVLKYIAYIYFIFAGILVILYFVVFFYPISFKEYDPSYLQNIKNNWLPKIICRSISPIISRKKSLYCYPRLIVTEEVMAKFSPEAFYIPRHLSMANIKEELKEQKLILEHGKRIDLSYRNLRYAELYKNILTRADMTGSLFDAADLRRSHMQAVDLTDASFIDAKLTEAKLQSAIFNKTNLHNVNLAQSNMNDSYFDGCNLINTRMQFAKLKKVNFGNSLNQKLRDASLKNTNLNNANLTDATFFNIDFTDASLQNANITGTVFNKSDLTGTDLSGAYFHITDDNYSSLHGLPSFKETKMLDVNISKYKKQYSNSIKKKNMILFELNVSIYPVVFDVLTLKKYPILSDKDIFRKYPDLFDANTSKRYLLLVDTNLSKE